jgi:hypothetical protein
VVDLVGSTACTPNGVLEQPGSAGIEGQESLRLEELLAQNTHVHPGRPRPDVPPPQEIAIRLDLCEYSVRIEETAQGLGASQTVEGGELEYPRHGFSLEGEG